MKTLDPTGLKRGKYRNSVTARDVWLLHTALQPATGRWFAVYRDEYANLYLLPAQEFLKRYRLLPGYAVRYRRKEKRK